MLVNLIKDKSEPATLASTLFAFGTDPRSLFTKSESDRWKLWCHALLGLDYKTKTEVRLKRFQQIKRDAERMLKEDDDDLNSPGVLDDPLLTKDGRWSRVFHFRDVLEQITKDVNRLFVEEDEANHAVLATNVLQLWSQLHEPVSYRQGMHELLRPIILCAMNEEEYLTKPDLLEADVYFAFDGLMREVVCLYETNEMTSNSMANATGATRQQQGQSLITFLNRICRDIHDRLLLRAAPDVKAKLDYFKIEPQLYALRWLRCLFTREFDLSKSFGFWDFLFCQTYFEPTRNSLVDMASFFSVAMLLRIRTRIMNASNQSEALEPLMRYPPFVDDEEAIQLALEGSKLRVLGDGPDPPKSVTVDESKLKQHRLGTRLKSILEQLEKEIIHGHSAANDQNNNNGDTDNNGHVLELIAKAKQIQDVLLDRLAEEDL